MSWRPSFDLARPDPRLDGFRDRVAVLTAGSAVVGYLLVECDFLCTHTSGHLWWRRWSEPQEMAVCLIELPGTDQHSDFWSHGPELDELVAEFGQGTFTYVGQTYRIRWLSSSDSTQAAREHFGVDSLGSRSTGRSRPPAD